MNGYNLLDLDLPWKEHLLIVACAGCITGMVTLPVRAQGVLEEVIITATKRETAAQDTGISLSALGEKRLEREGLDSFAQFATSVAGLSFGERGPGQSVVALRGINSSITQFNTDEPESKEAVGIYLDETPVSLNGFNPDLRTFDLNRIEVLRGPQGTLFGSGSMSGTIRYISNPPNPDAFATKVSVSYFDVSKGDDSQEYNGMLNVPLGSSTALRFTGFVRDLGGFVDNVAPATDTRDPGHPGGVKEDVNTDDTYGGRLQLLFQPHERIQTTVRLYYQQTETGGYPTEDTYNAAVPLAGNNPADAALGDYQQSRLFDEENEDEFMLYNLDLRFDLGFAELVSVTSYLERDLDSNYETTDFLPWLSSVGAPGFVDPDDGSPIFTYETDSRELLSNITETEDFIQEFRLVSTDGGAVDWLAGVFFNEQDKRFAQTAPNPGLDAAIGTMMFGDNVFISEQTFKDRQIALFGEIALDLNEEWRLITGVRFYKFEQDMFFDSIGGLFSAGIDVNRELNETGSNPKISLEFRPAERNELWYATIARGFRLGGTNDPLPPVCGITAEPGFESDSLLNYELGYKTGTDRFQFNSAVYYIDWNDVPVGGPLTCGFATTFNAGEARVIGVEADLKLALTESFEVAANASYNDAEFSDRFVRPPDGTFVIEDGTEMPLVPDFTFNASATWSFPLGNLFGGVNGYVNGTYSYQDDRYNSADVNTREKMDSYSLVNFRLGVESERWRAALFVNNLADKRAVIFKDTILLRHNRDSVTRPRSIGLNISFNF